MQRAFGALMTCLMLTLIPARLPASVPGETRADPPGSLKPGVSSSVFYTGGESKQAPTKRLTESLRYPGSRVDARRPDAHGVPNPLFASVPRRPGTGKRTAIAIVSSAILPGLGELYLYADSRDFSTLARVPVFFAIEGYLWYSYRQNHSKGKDIETSFRHYADEHWSLDRFLHQHPCCNQGVGDSCASWQDYNEHCQSEPNFFVYTPREADAQEYYENIGKYNAFVFGWDDASPWDYGNPDEFTQYQYWTPHRKYYWSQRQESDKYLLRADQRLMMLIVNRVVSMIDAGWIAHQMSKGDNPDKGWSLRLRTYDEVPCLMIGCRF